MNCKRALTTSARMGGPRRAAKFRTVSCERRTAKFLSGPASLRNVEEFMTTQRSKRYDFKELATNGYTGAGPSRASDRQQVARRLVKTGVGDTSAGGFQTARSFLR